MSKFNLQNKKKENNCPCNVHRIKACKETGAGIVLIAVRGVRAPPWTPAITQIPRDRSSWPRAARALFPSAPPTRLAERAPPAPHSSCTHTSPHVRGFSCKKKKVANSFLGRDVQINGVTAARSGDRLLQVYWIQPQNTPFKSNKFLWIVKEIIIIVLNIYKYNPQCAFYSPWLQASCKHDEQLDG